MELEELTQLPTANSKKIDRDRLIYLEGEGLINCKWRTDGKGNPTDFWGIEITVDGRQFVHAFDHPEKRKTNWAALAVLVSLAGLTIGVLWKLMG